MLRTQQVRTGITLPELLTVLVIVGVLALIAVPLFTNQLRDYRLAGTAETLHNDLSFARSEAIKRNATVYVAFNPGDTWCYGISYGSACNCTIANNCNLTAVSYDNPQQLTLSVSGMSGNTINFEGTNGSANASGSVTFTEYNLTPLVTITIGRLGGLQICSNTLSGYQGC